MRHPVIVVLAFTVLSLISFDVLGSTESRFELDVLVDGVARPEYTSGHSIYIEALRGLDYELRMTNRTPHRVAVALSVDGLNTIDARHTDSRKAAKWVLGPWDSTVISGWQVDSDHARRFFFTGEKSSYAASLGQTENLGVIEAVVYRERTPRTTWVSPERQKSQSRPSAPESAGAEERESKRRAAGEAAPQSADQNLDDDYAATGMGGRTRHEVRRVDLELETHPFATVRIRYEFRPQLVELGILRPSPLERRERSRGFDGYCPEP